MHRRLRSVVAFMLTALLTLSAMSACARKDAFDPSAAPVAVILVPEGRTSALVVVDLERFEVAKRVRLRSRSFSMDGDPASRTIATAQCGGLDAETDDVCGVYRLGARRVEYVKLPVPNPLDVAVSDGRAYLVHGFVTQDRLRTSVVRLSSRKVVHSGGLAVESQRPERSAGRVLVPVPARAAEEGAGPTRTGSLMELNESGTATVVADLPLSNCTMIVSDEERRALTIGRDHARDSGGTRGWSILALDVAEGRVATSVAAPWVSKGVECAGCVTADGVAIADSTGEDPGDTGHEVFFLDPVTLAPRFTRTLEGMPAALAPWGECTLVVDGSKGELLLYRKGSLRPTRRLHLCDRPNLVADMVVFDGPAQGGDSVDKAR